MPCYISKNAIWLDVNLEAIKAAVLGGATVKWGGSDYEVRYDPESESFFIYSLATMHSISLAWADGITLNGRPSEFFISDS
jgi:hypothetical protein